MGRWRRGSPRSEGVYFCRLADGREVLVNYSPVWDSEILPDGALVDGNDIAAFQRVAGERYRNAYRDPVRRKAKREAE